jgi:hypothetical protein
VSAEDDRLGTGRPAPRVTRARASGSETRSSWKTSELLMFLLISAGIFVAADHVGTSGANAFTAQRAWLYVTVLGSAYMISRGLAKSGSRANEEDDPRTGR